jgi:HSF-type DNA-binding
VVSFGLEFCLVFGLEMLKMGCREFLPGICIYVIYFLFCTQFRISPNNVSNKPSFFHCVRYDNGKTFVVKDPERFAAEVIPEYFKHNNFSSFVRQLNFYGFKKIKSDPLRLRDAETSDESKFWKFKHEYFQRGRLDLLCQIRKNHNDTTVDKREVESLKRDNRDLKGKLASVRDDVDKLNLLVNSLVKNQEVRQNLTCFPEVASKKRIVMGSSDEPLPITSETVVNDSMDCYDVATLQPLSTSSTSYHTEVQPASLDRTTTADTVDDEVLASLLGLDGNGDDLSILDNVPDHRYSKLPEDQSVDPDLMDKIHSALSKLPPPMQRLFVDRLVQAMGNPEDLLKQAEGMTTIIASAADEAQRRLVAAGRFPDDMHLAPIASVVLGAYLSRFMDQHAQALAPAFPQSEPVLSLGGDPFMEGDMSSSYQL